MLSPLNAGGQVEANKLISQGSFTMSPQCFVLMKYALSIYGSSLKPVCNVQR